MIKWNEVTWYSRLAALVLFIGIVPALAFYIGSKYEQTYSVVSAVHAPATPVSETTTSTQSTALFTNPDPQAIASATAETLAEDPDADPRNCLNSQYQQTFNDCESNLAGYYENVTDASYAEAAKYITPAQLKTLKNSWNTLENTTCQDIQGTEYEGGSIDDGVEASCEMYFTRLENQALKDTVLTDPVSGESKS